MTKPKGKLVALETEEESILVGRWAVSLAAPWITGSFRQFC